MRVELIIIDPQVSFCDPQNGELYVAGADKDITRLTDMVRRLGKKLDAIHVTLDSHRVVDIAHPLWWKDENGNHPQPFTVISPSDMQNHTWTTTHAGTYIRSFEYVKQLEKSGRYPLRIWPEHCLIGSQGQTIMPELAEALHDWERENFRLVDFVTKGSNIYTEHYSAVKAEVPDPSDPSTQLNKKLVDVLENADMVLWAGEAGSHCLRNTFIDTVNAFSNKDLIKRQILLTDATSPVTGFEDMQDEFIKDMTAKGMQTDTTVNVLK